MNAFDTLIGQKNAYIDELLDLIEEQKGWLKEQKKQVIGFDNQYKALLEMIVKDLEEQGLTKEEMLLYYNKKLWSKKT